MTLLISELLMLNVSKFGHGISFATKAVKITNIHMYLSLLANYIYLSHISYNMCAIIAIMAMFIIINYDENDVLV